MTNGLSGPRKQFLDVLRVLATCAVVLMHVLTGATDVTDASIVPEYRSLLLSVMDLVTWCVPIFLLISGYLFLNPERTLTYPVMIKKYCRRIALAILLFGVPYAASELVVAERTFRIRMIPEALKMTLTGHTWSHMWYLYLILFLYLITPLLKKVLRVLPVWGVAAVMAVIFLGSSVAPFLNKVLDVNSIPVLPDGGVYFLYYLCGYFFAVREVCVDKGRNVWRQYRMGRRNTKRGKSGMECVADSCGSADNGNDPQQDTRRILHSDGIQLSVYSTACSASVCCRMEWGRRQRGFGCPGEEQNTPDSLAGGGSLEFCRIPGTSGVCEPVV